MALMSVLTLGLIVVTQFASEGRQRRRGREGGRKGEVERRVRPVWRSFVRHGLTGDPRPGLVLGSGGRPGLEREPSEQSGHWVPY